MKKIKQYIFLAVFISICYPVSVISVEIPLGGSTGVLGSAEIANIGYVDIDLIFREHPMKKRLQAEFKSVYDKKMKESAELKVKIGKLRKVIVSSSTYVENLKSETDILQSNTQVKDVVTGTAAVSVPSVSPEIIKDMQNKIKLAKKDILKMKEAISKEELGYEKFIESARKDLLKLEQKHTSKVLADIYYLLEKVAIDENITIIVDKNNILYGKTAKDLTSSVLERLQGR